MTEPLRIFGKTAVPFVFDGNLVGVVLVPDVIAPEKIGKRKLLNHAGLLKKMFGRIVNVRSSNGVAITPVCFELPYFTSNEANYQAIGYNFHKNWYNSVHSMGSKEIYSENGLKNAWQNVLHPRDFEGFEADMSLVSSLLELMTPEEILLKSEFEKPFVISPEEFLSFDDLLSVRDEIRNLRLLPVKSESEYQRYHSNSLAKLRDEVVEYFDDTPFAFAENAFPYDIPQDVIQGITWLKDDSIPREKIAFFIANILGLMGKNDNEVILFERPLLTSTKLVRGSMPSFRHVHVWIKK